MNQGASAIQNGEEREMQKMTYEFRQKTGLKNSSPKRPYRLIIRCEGITIQLPAANTYDAANQATTYWNSVEAVKQQYAALELFSQAAPRSNR